MKPLIFWSILAMLLMIAVRGWQQHLQAARECRLLLLFFGSIPYFLLYAAYLQERTSSGCGPFQLLSRDYFWQGRGYSLRWVKQRFCCIASAIS